MSSASMLANPLVIVICLLLGLIVVLAILRPASPFLNFGIEMSAHIGDLRGSVNFEAFENNQPAFVMYFTEWCGHCKRTKPEFNKLMESYKGPVKIMMIDCEAAENAELVKQQGIKGFPTIRYYPSGMGSDFQEYSGERTFPQFQQFLNKVSGVLDRQPDNAAPV